MAKTSFLYQRSKIVSPSCIITRRSPFGSAARGTTGTQFLPSSAAAGVEGEGGETSVALHVITLTLLGEHVRGILDVGFVSSTAGKWWWASGMRRWRDNWAAEETPVVAVAMIGGYGRWEGGAFSVDGEAQNFMATQILIMTRRSTMLLKLFFSLIFIFCLKVIIIL